MSAHIFAIGRIDKSGIDVVLSPQQEVDICDAYTLGEMDADDGKPCEPLDYFSELRSIESYIQGWRHLPR